MHDNHRISPEPDRLAYHAMKNITRLHNHQQQMWRLERMKVALAHQILKQYHASALNIDHFVLAIKAAHAALDAGESFEQACAFAEQRIRELSQ